MTQLIENNVNATIKYISCGCNRRPHCLDWGNNNLVCYGSNNSVAVYDAGKSPYGRVEQTLQGHSGKVTVAQWIQHGSLDETEIISASADGTAIIWTGTDNNTSFRPSSVIKVGEPLSICTTISNSSNLYIFLGSIHGTFQIWQRSEKSGSDPTLLQTLNLNNKLALVAKFCLLPHNNKILLAIGLEDTRIQIFAQEGLTFEPKSMLVGHEDWVMSLDFTVDSGTVLLASGSQDHFIRLWKIKENVEQQTNQLHVTKHVFTVCDKIYEVTLESVLCGHNGWVYGLNWYNKDGCLKLLSASLDKTMIVWAIDPETGIWTEQVRMGDVGGNSLGFYGCRFAPDGEGVIAHGFLGLIYRWEHSRDDDNWTPLPAPTGHFDEVVDLFWDTHGRFLVTTSADQTTRIHAPWISNGIENRWYEISRPQVHGYNMSCATLISPNMFASGAEEKVVRIFVAPLTFNKYLNSITTCNRSADETSFEGSVFRRLDKDEELEENLVADSASVPALGLTNKAVFNKDAVREESLCSSIMLDYSRPPLEEELIQHTLWPEAEKLYGHGYELFAMAATSDGQLLATACKSTTQEHAAIILWSTKTWAQVQKLVFHQLTVTQLEFSRDSKYLLAVSRDRLWSVYQKNDKSYELFTNMEKNCLHKRIIWCCSWASDSSHFATGSRDGKIGIWRVDSSNDYKSIDTNGNSVTALSFAQSDISEEFEILAAGFESGIIEVYLGSKKFDNWVKVMTFDMSFAHHLTVKRLRFRPVNVQKKVQLASCGSDNAVKIYEIDLSEILVNELLKDN